MHWTVLIVFPWLYLFLSDLLATAIASAAFVVLLVVHELGHVAVLRKNKIPIQEIRLNGIHGDTAHGYASPGVDIAVAWGGVAAQLVVLMLALAVGYSADFSASPIASVIAGPVLLVFIKLNIFLMIVALLPIGPFDGHRAWAVIPWLRAAARRRRKAAREREHFPEKALSPERRRELEESSSKAAEELIGKLARKPEDRKEDA
jgi:Zn-dependent protease